MRSCSRTPIRSAERRRDFSFSLQNLIEGVAFMQLFACPVCMCPLKKEEKRYLCPHGHSFDLAKEGYVHLLPANRMHAKLPGDGKEMLAARRRILDAGYYEPFSDCLDTLVLESTEQAEKPVVLDAGCGEGYYTGRLLRALRERGSDARAAGFDISKIAVRMAAKRYPGLELAVGSVFHMPVVSNAADCLVSVFAPIVPEEFARVTKPGGILILAVAAPRHLFQLKEAVYTQPYENETRDTAYAGFTFLKRVPVRGEITLTSGEAVRDLFTMTPYHWKTSAEDREKLNALAGLTTEIGFDFLCYRRQEG